MSGDILTQLQTCYDQLLTQFFSTLSYLSQRHPLVAPDPDAADDYTNPPAVGVSADGQSSHGIVPGHEDTTRSIYPLRPMSPDTFARAQRELAADLVLKGQQIELLIARLPGIGRGEDQQAEDIQALVEQVRAMQEQRKAKRREMRLCVEQLDAIVAGMSESVEPSVESPPS